MTAPASRRAPFGARAALALSTLMLTACQPQEPAAVQLCKFAVQRALTGEGALSYVYVSRVPLAADRPLERVALEFAADPPADRTRSGAAACRVETQRYGVRLRALRIDGTPVPAATLNAIAADWQSAEDAGKLYQL
jgi:hypothetical protein